MTYKAPA